MLLAVAIAAMGVQSIFSNAAFAAPIYRETFQFCERTPGGSLQASVLVGWNALRKGKPLGDGGLLKTNTPGSPNVLAPFQSLPIGLTPGAAFWVRDTTGLTIFTSEFSFDTSTITSITYDQRFDGFDSGLQVRDGSRVALLIGDTWYISDQTFNVNKRSVWESVSFDLTTATFGTFTPLAGRGPNSPLNSGVSLPANAVVTAFGVYVPRVSDRVRVDNFTLNDNSPAGSTGSGAIPDLVPCPSVVNGTPSPTPTVQIANPQATPQAPQTFCSESQLQSLGTLRISAKVRKDVVLNLPARTLKGRRDRALLSLLFTSQPRIDGLVNTIVSDVDTGAGILKIPSPNRPDGTLDTSGKTIDVKLTPFAKKMMTAYLAMYAKDGNKTKALFPRVNRSTENLIATTLCTPQFKRLVRLRALRFGIKIRFNS